MKRLKPVFLCSVFIWITGLVCAVPFEDIGPDLLDHGWVPVHDRMIAVRYVNRVLNNHRREFPRAAFHISSPDDPAYANPRAAVSQSYWVRPARYTLRKPINIKHAWVYVELPEPMKAGATYTVTDSELTWLPLAVETGLPIRSQPEQTPAVTNIWHGDTLHRSPSLQVNQVGYLPGARKFGYLMQFAGYEGASHDNPVDADFGRYETFNVVDAATGAVRWQGRVGSPLLDGEKDRLSQSRVWKLDFSGFTTPGRYRLQVPGVGVSFPFSIGAEAYNHAFGVLMRGMYHQRCGTALEMPWTRHTHPACHMDDALVPQLEQYRRPELDFFPQQVGETLHCVGGHHDAGDFGKYTINGATVVYSLLQPFEVYPDRLGFDQSPIPEAGNGIPDILEVAKWELNWLSGMQDPVDGGVHIIVKPHPTGSYENSVAGQPTSKFEEQRSLWWKDTHTTAAFAAALARAARTPGIQQHWPEDARRYLEQAEKAWAFCMEHTEEDGSPLPIVGGHHYGGIQGAADEYAWMAVELWLTTGEQKYHDYFLKHHNLEASWHWTWWPLIEAGGHATRAYAYGLREGKDPEMLRQCLDGPRGVITAAQHVLRWQNEWATRPSFATDAFRFNQWGWYFLSDIASYDLLLAASLVEGEERVAFIQGALFNADQEFGNSADNRTAITGIGARRPVDIVHQNDLYDGRVEPPPGIPLGFHPAGMNRGRSDRGLMVSHTVGDLPIAYRYVDCWNIEQEFTIDRLAKTMMTYAMLSNVRHQKGGFPTLSITANGHPSSISGILPYTVRFTADTAGANGKQVREVFWDLSNEETHVGFDFSYTFTVPGRYVVVATATDEAGWPAFAEVEVLVRPPVAGQPNQGQPWEEEVNTYGLWHFDGNLHDAAFQRPAELVGNARMSPENVLWMANPAGQSIHIDGASDGIRIPLPNNLLSDEGNRGFTVDAMVLYGKDVRKGGGHSHILMIHGGWDLQLGLFKGTWDDREIRGLPGDYDRKDAVNQKVMTLTRPRPEWVHMQLGFDRERSTAFLAVDGEKIEWPFTPPENERNLTLHIGGFHGYVDEVRVNIHR